MLQKTRIKDFQSLHDIEIEHGGLTVLTGQSDLGKSAIIRAMRLLHRNNGTASFVRYGKPKLKVEQIFDDGNTVVIEKAKTVNAYTVNGQHLAKIGKEVPETVREILQTDELVLDKDLTCDLNFSGQFDPPFLLTESSTLVTKVISTLSGIEIIYSAIREGASQGQKLKAISQVLFGNVAMLEKFDGLQSEAEGLQSDLSGLTIDENRLTTISQDIEKMVLLKQRAEILQAKVVDVAPEEEALNSLITVHNNFSALEGAIKSLEALKSRSEALSAREIGDLEPIFALNEKIKLIFSVVNQDEISYNNLVEKKKSWDNLSLNYNNVVNGLESLEKEESELKLSVKVCDKCGRIL
jgi:energy-coupling factor transporter ATP-binding protein EcfA2